MWSSRPRQKQQRNNSKRKIMGTINFTKDNYSKMCGLALNMLLDNSTITTKIGQTLNIVELIHTTTINTLNSIRIGLSKEIANLENQDEWVVGEATQKKLEKAKEQKELVNLIIGYKRKLLEAKELGEKKAELTKQLKALEESQKTPEDKIKEIKEQLASLEEPNF